MPRKKAQNYSPEFVKAAINLAGEPGQNIESAAAQLQIEPKMLIRWLRTANRNLEIENQILREYIDYAEKKKAALFEDALRKNQIIP